MKFFKIIFFLLVSIQCFSQKEETKFYDYKWQPCDISKARFFSSTEKTDSGWLRNDYFISTKKLQMTALYKDSGCKIMNGYVKYYYANGNLEAMGKKINNKKNGLYLSFHYNGMMADSGFYNNDRIQGTKLAWHPNGNMSDSFFQKNDSTLISVSWFDNGNPSDYGYFINEKKHGKWNYFHNNGKPACIELMDHGKLVLAEFFDENGSPQTDTSSVNKEAAFKGGLAGWSNYIQDKIYWPSEYQITNSDVAVVIVGFTLNEEGKVEDAHIVTPFHPLMDNIALSVIKKAPLWKPKIEHNRRIKEFLRQPVTFVQER